MILPIQKYVIQNKLKWENVNIRTYNQSYFSKLISMNLLEKKTVNSELFQRLLSSLYFSIFLRIVSFFF